VCIAVILKYSNQNAEVRDMIVEIPFNLVRLNEVANTREIVFPYGNDWYRMSWEDTPERFKELYVAWLKLQGIEIPEWLKDYEKDTIDIKDVNIEIDLSKCEKIPAVYPLAR